MGLPSRPLALLRWKHPWQPSAGSAGVPGVLPRQAAYARIGVLAPPLTPTQPHPTNPPPRRPTMILYNIDNIRDLFGHKVSLSMVKQNPICRLGL